MTSSFAQMSASAPKQKQTQKRKSSRAGESHSAKKAKISRDDDKQASDLLKQKSSNGVGVKSRSKKGEQKSSNGVGVKSRSKKGEQKSSNGTKNKAKAQKTKKKKLPSFLETEDFYLFSGGLFSNWTGSPITLNALQLVLNTDDKKELAALFQMACKALIFKDFDKYFEICAETSPLRMKVLGRKVENFDEKVWTEKGHPLVRLAVLEKFTKHPPSKEALLATGKRRIAEASPRDCIWGIGLGPHDPRAQDPKQWRGQNLLGKAIEDVRDKLVAAG